MSARVELINTLYLECGYLLDGAPLFYPFDQEALVREAAARLRPMPEEPDWHDISDGMPWGSDVGRAVDEVMKAWRARQAEAQPEQE